MRRYYSMPKDTLKVIRRSSPKTGIKLWREHEKKVRYLTLANSDRRAREMANRFAANRNINYVRRAINIYTGTYKRAMNRKLPNNNTEIYSFFPHSKVTLKKFIYHLKQHLKRLEFAKFLGGRKVAELMMPKARAHFYSLAAK